MLDRDVGDQENMSWYHKIYNRHVVTAELQEQAKIMEQDDYKWHCETHK